MGYYHYLLPQSNVPLVDATGRALPYSQQPYVPEDDRTTEATDGQAISLEEQWY